MNFKSGFQKHTNHHYLKSVQSTMYREQQTDVQYKGYTL